MKNQKIKIKIPLPQRNGSLVSRFVPIILIGADTILDKKSRLYIRLLVRLIDKAFLEYKNATELIEEELKTNDKFANRFNIINHLENSVSAISRSIKILDIIINGKIIKKNINGSTVNQKIKNNIVILNFLSVSSIKKINNYKTSSIRNRIEHIDEDIYFNKFKKNLFLDIDGNYEKITISNKFIMLTDYVKILEDYHSFVSEVFLKLPNRWENGKYYYDKK